MSLGGNPTRSPLVPSRLAIPHSMPSPEESTDENDHPAATSARTHSASPAQSQRSLGSAHLSDHDLRERLHTRAVAEATEATSLLDGSNGKPQSYRSTPATPRPGLSRLESGSGTPPATRYHPRSNSWSFKLASALNRGFGSGDDHMTDSKGSILTDDRVWYDQYTSTDWVHDSIADNFRVRDLRARRDIRGRLIAWFDGAQGWILAALVGFTTACIAYFVDVTEVSIFDIKEGYCTEGFYIPRNQCCLNEEDCPLWRTWGDALNAKGLERDTVDFIVYVGSVVLFAVAACLLTLTTKTVVTSSTSLPTVDEDLSAKPTSLPTDAKTAVHAVGMGLTQTQNDARPIHQSVYYPAAGSGVAEVKVILSGFVLHGYLGLKTLIIKTLGLVLAVASGLSLGKEGPLVHIGTCVGNIFCRIFSKYNHNDGKRREVLSASAAGGVAVAFGAPLAGTLFSLEEVSYYFPPKTLFRTFFCCIAAALSLKFLDPYGTGKIVIFEVRYVTDWKFYEIFAFMFLGILGGGIGALFIKASRVWASTFRRIAIIKKYPLLEVILVALTTGLLSFWNRYAKLPVTQLLYELAGPCKSNQKSGLCPSDMDEIQAIIQTLGVAFILKGFLTTITFGIKVPAGIYVPSMVVGGLLGRIVGHTIQYLSLAYPKASLFAECSSSAGHAEGCVTPGVYALIAAGATMCGVTRLSVTLVVILFELTGSLDHVLPFSLSVLVAKWTADAIEPLSIYDLLTEMNSYPFLDNKIRPVFTSELGDITPRVRSERIIDVSESPLVPATLLRGHLQLLHDSGELDGGLPILRNGVLVGLIPAPDLEYALDRLDDEDETLCLMVPRPHPVAANELADAEEDPTDFTVYVDPAPVTLDIRSPMDLVYQCFVKLGLRFICVLHDGRYAGLVHKKAFVKYVKELEEEENQRHRRR